MKNKLAKLTPLFLIMAVVFVCCTLKEIENKDVTSRDTQVTTTRSDATWDYPVKPDSEEWKTTSYAEKVAKSQPPKGLLSSWDTETLLQFCVDYPLNKVTLLFNNPNDGFKRAYEQSSVWEEFIQRKDALKLLSQYIEARPYKLLFEMTDIEALNNELFILFFLEKVISETNFVDYLNSPDKKELADIILQNHLSKKEYPYEFMGFSYNSSLSALLKILESDQVVSSNGEYSLTNFREKTGYEYSVDNEMDLAIITLTSNYIDQ